MRYMNLHLHLRYGSQNWVMASESRRKGSDVPSLFGSLSG